MLTLSPGAVFARDWVAYSSENFTVYSDRPERRIVETLERFELFRTVALEMINAPNEPESDRLRIFMFDRNVDFNRMQGRMRVGGFFYHSVSGPRMLISPDGDDEILFHEYVHHLMHLHSDVNYPRWYGEGLAQVLESMEFTETEVQVGLPAENYEYLSLLGAVVGQQLSRAPLSEMIAVQPRVASGAFYATAWLMTHYFLIDSADDPTRLQQTADYLLRFDGGQDPVEAFSASYGISPREMDGRLDEYVRNRQFKTMVFPGMEDAPQLERTTLAEEEALFLLADLAVELNRNDAADKYIGQMNRRVSDTPLGIKLQSVEAVALIHDEQVEDADALVEELLTHDSHDADSLAKIMHYSTDRALVAREEDDDESGEFHLERAIRIGEIVVSQDPNHLESLYFLGRAYEMTGDLETAAATLLQFYSINPTVPTVNLLLAKLFITGGNSALGSQFLARVYSASHTEEGRAELDEIRERIDDTQFATEKLEELLVSS